MHDVEILLNRACQFAIAFETAVGDGVGAVDPPLGLDAPRVGVLIALDLFGPMRPTAIGSLIGMPSGSTSKLVDRLERRDLVSRRRSPEQDDRRAIEVVLTDAGRDALVVCDRVVADLSIDLLAALVAVDLKGPSDSYIAPLSPVVPGSEVISSGPAMAELFRFIAELDRPLTTTVGDLTFLHPADPRGVLVLSEIHLRGPIRLGDLPALIDRSRGASARLVTKLTDAGLVVQPVGTVPEDRRIVVIELTPVGTALIRGVIAAVAAHLPTIRPTIVGSCERSRVFGRASARHLELDRVGLDRARPRDLSLPPVGRTGLSRRPRGFTTVAPAATASLQSMFR